jgi:hypothetical protein
VSGEDKGTYPISRLMAERSALFDSPQKPRRRLAPWQRDIIIFVLGMVAGAAFIIIAAYTVPL